MPNAALKAGLPPKRSPRHTTAPNWSGVLNARLGATFIKELNGYGHALAGRSAPRVKNCQ